jgi:hypothetical protein
MEKNEADVCRKFVRGNSTIQTIYKNGTKIRSAFNTAILKVWMKWRRWGAASVIVATEKLQCTSELSLLMVTFVLPEF